jgi:hypothetical protein
VRWTRLFEWEESVRHILKSLLKTVVNAKDFAYNNGYGCKDAATDDE